MATLNPDGSIAPDVRLNGGYRYEPPRIGSPEPNRHQRVPSIAEQLGVDPISKLADAINNLAAALRERPLP